jgi:hypothetical protein
MTKTTYQFGETPKSSYIKSQYYMSMYENEEIPAFPPRSIVGRILELGFLSGPWNRSELEGRWGPSTTNKFIQEAKEFGWLVSPFQNEFFVPSAQDLMVVGWLPRPQRQEFIISRTLAATGMRFWCLSAWMRTYELEFPEPLFVSDLAGAPRLGDRRKKRSTFPPAKEIRERNLSIVKRLRRIPFLSNLVIVPELPQTGRFGFPAKVVLPRGVSQKPLRWDWLVEDDSSENIEDMRIQRVTRSSGREIRFLLSARVDDPAWVIAFLIALGLPRIQEKLPRVLEREIQRQTFYRIQEIESNGAIRVRIEEDLLKRIRNWGAFLGQPAPNDSWQRVLSEGLFPYLLVPWALWNELASFSASWRLQSVHNLRGLLDAEPRGSD